MSQPYTALRTDQVKAPVRTGGRVTELDGLRGIAILLVLGFHFMVKTGPAYALDYLFQIGWSGVDLFFVLSGYLITGILLDSKGKPHYYRNFIIRRTLRIFPLYYASLLIVAYLTFYPYPIRWHDFLHTGDGWWYLSYVGNIRSFLKNDWPGAALLTPLWSLQVEEQFYLSFPFLVWAVKRGTLAKVLASSVAFALLLRIVLAITMPKYLLGTYMLMPCRMDALAMGGLIAIARREKPEWLTSRWVRRGTAISAAIAVAICVIWGSNPWSTAMRTLGYTSIDLTYTGLLVMLISSPTGTWGKICRWRWLVWTGVVSYGLYLLHGPARVVVRQIVGPKLGIAEAGSLEFLFLMAVAISAAALSWWCFESPILKLKDRFTAR
jgi:peptidoglycan/LPS O-acetylase OafA/YrhL